MSDRALRIAIAALALAGAGVAAYLTVTKLSGAAPVCSTGGCETVQSSRYSELAAAAGTAVALAAAVYAGYLLYVQAAVIDAFCQWCLTSDAVLLVLVPLTVLRLLRA